MYPVSPVNPNPFINQFPYMDCHEMNLDWIIKTVKLLNEKVDTYTILNQITYQGRWSITKQYTKWSIVFYNGIAYLSLQPVPGNVPIDNTDYWMIIAPYAPEDHFDDDSINPVQNKVVTEKFTEVEEAISDEKSAREEAISDEKSAREDADTALGDRIDVAEDAIAKLSNYVTPEMMGSVATEADANTSIAAAIAYAESHNVPVCIFSNITYSEPIVLTSRNLKLYIFGSLTYTGNDYAIICKWPRQTVYVYKLTAANGGGIKVDTSDFSVEYLNVKMDFADCLKECFHCKTTNSNYVVYVKCWGRLWKSSSEYDCIRIEKGSDGSYIGEVSFFDMKVLGKNGIYSKGPSISAVRAIRVSVEAISEIGFIIENSLSCDIIDPRYAELQGRNSTVVKMIGAIGLKFTGNYLLNITALDDTELSASTSNSIVYQVPIAIAGARFASGLSILRSGKALLQPHLSSKVYGDTTINVDPFLSTGFIQTIRVNLNDDCEINLSEYHIAETYPYVAVNIPGSHTYTVKDHTGTTIATLSGYGQYLITLDFNHFVIKKE